MRQQQITRFKNIILILSQINNICIPHTVSIKSTTRKSFYASYRIAVRASDLFNIRPIFY